MKNFNFNGILYINKFKVFFKIYFVNFVVDINLLGKTVPNYQRVVLVNSVSTMKNFYFEGKQIFIFFKY